MDNKKITAKVIIQEVVLVLFSILELVPIYYFAISAFKKRVDIVQHPLAISAETFITTNFPYAIKKMKFFEALRNTGVMTVVSMLIIIVLASLAGFAIARIKWKPFDIYYKIVMSCMVIPFIGCLLPLVAQATQMNIYNSLVGVILIEAAWNLPFSIFLYAGFMGGISKELEEAAYIDGCTTWGVYWKIFLPLLAPVTATCCIRNGVGIWNDYLVSNSLLNPNATPTIMVGINKFFGKYTTEYGYAFAGIMLSSLPMVIMFMFLQKYFIKGITVGSVKG